MTAVGGTGVATPDLLVQYRAGREGTVLADRSALGRLAIGGKDAFDLLHRLTTNNVKDLRPGEGIAAVFATAKGRVLDLVTLHRVQDRLICLCGDGRAKPVADWIERYTFREEVTVGDLSESHGTLALYGPGSGAGADRLFGGGVSDRLIHHMVEKTLDGVPVLVCRTFPLGGDGVLMTAEASFMAALRERLLGSGTVVPAGEECLEVLRIEAGMPVAGRELTEDYNPWEARLDDAISLDKGCYVGQEVIARLDTYKKVSRLLVRLRVRGGAVPAPGAELKLDGEATGRITSATAIPGTGEAVALGYVRDEHAVAGREVLAGTAGSWIPATIEGVAR